MTTPRIIASGQGGAADLSDGLYTDIGYTEYDGLFAPAMVSKGALLETFAGPVKVRSQAGHYLPRQISLGNVGLIGGNGLAELRRRSHDLLEMIQGRSGRLQLGSLFFSVEWDPAAELKRFESTKRLELSLSGEALPATMTSFYGYSVGGTESIRTIDDRPDRTELKFTDISTNGRVWSVTNPGSAPTMLSLTISGASLTSSKVHYIRNRTASASSRVVAFATGAAETIKAAYLAPSSGLICLPGVNIFAIEYDDGSVVTAGTFKAAIWGTIWQYLGNDGDKFNESPIILSHARRDIAYVVDSTATDAITAIGDMAPRIGTASVLYTAAKAGLVLEGESINLLTRSEEFTHADWQLSNTPIRTADTLTAPDGTTTMDTVEDDDAAFFEAIFQDKTSADNDWFTASIYIAKTATTTVPEFELSYQLGATPLDLFVQLNRNTGAINTRTDTGGGGIVKVFEDNGSWRLCLSKQNNATGNTRVRVVLYPAVTTTAAMGTFDATKTGTVTVWGANLMKQPFPTSYVRTVAAQNTRYADYAALWAPHNYMKYARSLGSNDATDKGRWVKPTGTTVTSDISAASDGTTTCDRVAFAAPTDYIYQSITPEVQPNSHPWFAVWGLRKGALISGNKIDLRIEDQGGALIGSAVTIDGDDLSTTETRSIPISITAAQVGSDDTGFRVMMKGNSGANGVDVDHVRFIRGKFPGTLVLSEGAVVLPADEAWTWPTWLSQNGYVQFSALLPPISTGKNYAVFGDAANFVAADMRLCLFRPTAATTAQNFLRIVKSRNSGIQDSSDINVGAIWDDVMHTYKIQWRNELSAGGTRYMDLRLDIDNVNKYASGNVASSTITSWSNPERFILSAGDVFAAIRDLTFGAPSLNTSTDYPEHYLP